MSIVVSKKPLQSKGIWGGLLTLAGTLGMVAEQLADIPILGDYAPILTGIGGVISIIGRVFATTTIKF